MATTHRHLELVPDTSADDRDPTDLGLPPQWGPERWGRPVRLAPASPRSRDAAIATVAAEQSWPGSPDEQALRRLALRRDCPRDACRAPATHQCRRRVRGRWRPIEGIHTERTAEAAADLVSAGTDPDR